MYPLHLTYIMHHGKQLPKELFHIFFKFMKENCIAKFMSINEINKSCETIVKMYVFLLNNQLFVTHIKVIIFNFTNCAYFINFLVSFLKKHSNYFEGKVFM